MLLAHSSPSVSGSFSSDGLPRVIGTFPPGNSGSGCEWAQQEAAVLQVTQAECVLSTGPEAVHAR